MRVAVAGASGFVGRRLVQMLLGQSEDAIDAMERLTVSDARLPPFQNDSRLNLVEGDLGESDTRARLIGSGVDVLFHLAAVPGGAAEADYRLSRRVNLDSTLSLFEAAAGAASAPRIVYTSTIAVFGAKLPSVVDDQTPLAPELTYGARKLMVEVALADLTRRGAIDGVAVRLRGIVARPPAAAGMRSPFMSNLFHALLARRPFTSPVSPWATMWMMSVGQCAANLLHAAKVSPQALPPGRVATLPGLRLTMAELGRRLRRGQRGRDAGLLRV